MKFDKEVLAVFLAFIAIIFLTSFLLIDFNSGIQLSKIELSITEEQQKVDQVQKFIDNWPLWLFLGSELLALIPTKTNGIIHGIVMFARKFRRGYPRSFQR